MPFTRKYTPPNVHDLQPEDDNFNPEVDRLLVGTDRDETVILAWSGRDRTSGLLILALEAVPDNVAEHFQGMLDPFEFTPESIVQPVLSVLQKSNHCLEFNLEHPIHRGSFEMSGQVVRVRSVTRGQYEHTREVVGYARLITRRQYAS